MKDKKDYIEMCIVLNTFLKNGISTESVDQAVQLLNIKPKVIEFDGDYFSCRIGNLVIHTGCDGLAPEDWKGIHIEMYDEGGKQLYHLVSDMCNIDFDDSVVEEFKAKYPITRDLTV